MKTPLISDETWRIFQKHTDAPDSYRPQFEREMREGMMARREGRFVPWSEVKKEFGIT